MARSANRARRLPIGLRPLFWDHDFARLSWQTDADLITGRILTVGDWDAIRWLLLRLGKPALGACWRHRGGAGLGGRQWLCWGTILELHRRQVNRGLRAPGRQVWG